MTTDRVDDLLPPAVATRRLRAALRANAAFSAATGSAMLIVGVVATESLGVKPTWILPSLGVGLIGFATTVALVAALPRAALLARGRLVIAADVAWVFASVGVLAVGDLPTSGQLAVSATASIVAAVAAWQSSGIRIASSSADGGDLEAFTTRRRIDAPADVVWSIVSDHDLYGRLAPNLSRVEVLSGSGPTVRRRCVSASGSAWEESCVLYDVGHQHAVEVDAQTYPYPLALMRGLWRVEPSAGASIVEMRFAYRAQPGLRGALFTLIMRPAFTLALQRIFKGWTAAALAERPQAAPMAAH